MSAFPNWRKYIVGQKRMKTGCIPTGYEILLRAANTQGIDWTTFQDEFDLDKNGGKLLNNFMSVADAVKDRYPSIHFKREVFPQGDGCKKLARIEEFIQQQRPVLVSLAQTPKGGWHIMLVVDSDFDSLTLVHHMDRDTHQIYIQKISKKEFVFKHDTYPGGDDIAYL